MTTNPQATLYESRLINGKTFFATTNFQSIAAGGTYALEVEHDGTKNVLYIISAVEAHSEGPIKVRTYENPDSTSGESAATLQNATVGDTSTIDHLNATKGISFTGATLRTGDISGSGKGANIAGGQSNAGFTSITKGADYIVEVENTDSSSHESIITIFGLRF